MGVGPDDRSSARLRLTQILGAHPPHAISTGDQAPPAVLREQPHPQQTGRPPAVDLDRRVQQAVAEWSARCITRQVDPPQRLPAGSDGSAFIASSADNRSAAHSSAGAY